MRFFILKIVVVVFCITGVLGSYGNEESIRSDVQLYGIDNFQLPNDSLVLMNSLLIDYQVDYDLAIANKNPKEIVIALHKIGLVYYQLNELDLAENYSWRLLNVANKYEFSSQKIFAYALLYRINLRNNRTEQAKGFYQKYEALCENYKMADSSFVLVQDLKKTESTINKIQEEEQESQSPIVIKDLKVKSSGLNMNYFILSLFLVAVIISLLIWKNGVLFQKNVVLMNDQAASADIEVGSNSFVSIQNHEKEGLDEVVLEKEFENPITERFEEPEKVFEEEKFEFKDKDEAPFPVEDLNTESKEFSTFSIAEFIKDIHVSVDQEEWEFSFVGNESNFSGMDRTSVKEILDIISRQSKASSNFKSGNSLISVSKNGVVVLVNLIPIDKRLSILSGLEISALKKSINHLSDYQFKLGTNANGGHQLVFKKYI